MVKFGKCPVLYWEGIGPVLRLTGEVRSVEENLAALVGKGKSSQQRARQRQRPRADCTASARAKSAGQERNGQPLRGTGRRHAERLRGKRDLVIPGSEE